MGELLEMLRGSRSFRVQVAAACAIAASLSLFTYWAFDRDPPIIFDGERSYIIPPAALGGDQMRVIWVLKEAPRRICSGEVRRVLFDPDTNVQIAIYDKDTAATIGAFAGNQLTKTFALPKQMPKGRIGYRSDLCYACNPLQELFTAARICYSTPTLYFTVD